MRYLRWVLSLAVLALVPEVGRAQPRVNHDTTVLRSGYAGSAACADCHKKETAQFSKSTMGQVMLGKPRDNHEALGCESCHGPGKQHAESGGEERGALIAFGRKSPAPVAGTTPSVCPATRRRRAPCGKAVPTRRETSLAPTVTPSCTPTPSAAT